VSYDVTGRIDAIFDPDGVAPFPMLLGDALSARLVFDDAAADTAPSPTRGSYDGAPLTALVQVGSNSVTWIDDRSGAIIVLNDQPVVSHVDAYGYRTRGWTSSTSGGYLSLQLWNSAASPPVTPFSSDALPGTPPIPGQFSIGGGSFVFVTKDGGSSVPSGGGGVDLFTTVYFTIDSIVGRPDFPSAPFFADGSPFPGDFQNYPVFDQDTLTLVPVPAAAWLLVSALAGLGVFARRTDEAHARAE
jgi:hypothetical protein